VFPVRYGQTYRVELNFKLKDDESVGLVAELYINIPLSQTYKQH
jgi:hypothetical protein